MSKFGVLLYANEINESVLDTLEQHEAKSLSIAFWEKVDKDSLLATAKLLKKYHFTISAISVFGNTLSNDDTYEGWKILIEHNKLFGNPYVSGFAGRLINKSVEESLPEFNIRFTYLLYLATEYNCKGLLLETCKLGDTWNRGKWNIAINPRAWKLIFDTISDERLGLEWEPYHQIVSFMTPLPQLVTWMHYIKHIHGKDAHLDQDNLEENGLYDKEKAILPALPGFGDTNWIDLCYILHQFKYKGSIDIEIQNSNYIKSKEKILNSLDFLKTNCYY
jgi:sugar phosphate isomerase/epimerase